MGNGKQLLASGRRMVSGDLAGMALGDESEFRAGEQADTRGAHHDKWRATDVSAANFSDLVAIAMPAASSRMISEMLQGKASHAAIRHWRNGRRKPPKWILDRLYLLAIERVQRLSSAIDPAIVRGVLGSHNLRSFMARRARERDAKKKPG